MSLVTSDTSTVGSLFLLMMNALLLRQCMRMRMPVFNFQIFFSVIGFSNVCYLVVEFRF